MRALVLKHTWTRSTYKHTFSQSDTHSLAHTFTHKHQFLLRNHTESEEGWAGGLVGLVRWC